MSLIELLTSLMITSFVMLGFGALLVNGMKGFQRASNDVYTTNANAQSMRRITEALRGGMNVAITNSGKTITTAVLETSALWNSMGQILVGAADGTLYAFGANLERHL